MKYPELIHWFLFTQSHLTGIMRGKINCFSVTLAVCISNGMVAWSHWKMTKFENHRHSSTKQLLRTWKTLQYILEGCELGGRLLQLAPQWIASGIAYFKKVCTNSSSYCSVEMIRDRLQISLLILSEFKWTR